MSRRVECTQWHGVDLQKRWTMSIHRFHPFHPSAPHKTMQHICIMIKTGGLVYVSDVVVDVCLGEKSRYTGSNSTYLQYHTGITGSTYYQDCLGYYKLLILHTYQFTYSHILINKIKSQFRGYWQYIYYTYQELLTALSFA